MHPAPAPRRLPDLPPVLLLVALIAFIPGGLFPFVWAKILLLGGALLLHAFAPVRHAVLPRTDVLLLLAGLAWLTVAAFAASSALPSLLGRWPRYEGIPVILSYAGCVVMGAHVLGGSPASNLNSARRTFLDAAAATAVVIGLVALIEVAGLRPLGGSPDVRPGSTLGNASDLGLAAVMLVAMLLPAAQASRSRLHVVGAAVAAITVGVSGSRAALVGLLAVLAVLAIGVLGVRRRAARSLSAPVPPPLAVATRSGSPRRRRHPSRSRLSATVSPPPEPLRAGLHCGTPLSTSSPPARSPARAEAGSWTPSRSTSPGRSPSNSAAPRCTIPPRVDPAGGQRGWHCPGHDRHRPRGARAVGGTLDAALPEPVPPGRARGGRGVRNGQSHALHQSRNNPARSHARRRCPCATIAAPLPTAATRPVMLIRAVAGGRLGSLFLQLWLRRCPSCP